MKKLLSTSILCAFSVFLGSTASQAVDFPEHYRVLDVHAEYTKQSKDFTVKNVFPFHFPDGLPGVPVFKGAKGQFATVTQTKWNDDKTQDITNSETLFGVEILKNACPKAGDGVLSLDSAYGASNHRGLIGNIVKQTKGDTTQVSNIDFTLPYNIPMDMGDTGCGVVMFDGSDFTGYPYTMKADLQLKYTFQPISVGLDGEFIIDVDNQTKTALNAYVVIPVKSGSGPGKGVIRPGTIFNVNGNIATTAAYAKTAGNWFVRYVTAVYKNNSCQVAFKNHSDTKFFWNSKTGIGIGQESNKSSALWPTATIISDFTVAGHDRETVMKQATGNNNLPVHVEDGDCVVQVGMPSGDTSTVAGSNLNMESQVGITYIPD